MRGKLTVLLAAGALMLVLTAGTAYAGLIEVCIGEICAGTSGKDTLTGTAIDNTIVGKGGSDTLVDTDGSDSDTIRGNKGNDKINVKEGNSSASNTDFVNCGPGKDTVFVDDKDRKSGCERVNPN